MSSLIDFIFIFKGICKFFLHKLILKLAFLGLGWAQVYWSQLELMPYLASFLGGGINTLSTISTYIKIWDTDCIKYSINSGSHQKTKSLKVGTLSQPLLTPRPPTKLGTPYVFQGPNKLVGTHFSPYQIGGLGHPTHLARPPAPCWDNVPTFGLFVFWWLP